MRQAAFLLLSVTLALVGACDRRRDTETRAMAARVMDGVLAYPGSSVVSLSAGQDAAQVVLEAPASLAQVTTWFRQALRLNGWEFQSDITNRDGSVTMLAQKGKRPLWATFQANGAAPSTTYTLVGAILTAGDSLGGTAGRE